MQEKTDRRSPQARKAAYESQRLCWTRMQDYSTQPIGNWRWRVCHAATVSPMPTSTTVTFIDWFYLNEQGEVRFDGKAVSEELTALAVGDVRNATFLIREVIKEGRKIIDYRYKVMVLEADVLYDPHLTVIVPDKTTAWPMDYAVENIILATERLNAIDREAKRKVEQTGVDEFNQMLRKLRERVESTDSDMVAVDRKLLVSILNML
ncbi:MAG: hypothetical protein KC496_09295 [Anaerolineae bacterium]|nr:hypothetical protein [Anaerolineae bacterium]